MTKGKELRELIERYYRVIDSTDFWLAACSDANDDSREDQDDVSSDDGDSDGASGSGSSTSKRTTTPPRAR